LQTSFQVVASSFPESILYLLKVLHAASDQFAD